MNVLVLKSCGFFLIYNALCPFEAVKIYKFSTSWIASSSNLDNNSMYFSMIRKNKNEITEKLEISNKNQFSSFVVIQKCITVEILNSY